jgi:hypothetical protein
MITKAVFNNVAQVIAHARHYTGAYSGHPSLSGEALRLTIATHLADLFANHNERFDRKRFLKACRGEE